MMLHRSARESKLAGIDLKAADSQRLPSTRHVCSAAGRTCDTHTETPASLLASWWSQPVVSRLKLAPEHARVSYLAETENWRRRRISQLVPDEDEVIERVRNERL